mmetsp:Transcript_67254/g.217050  ORF Transcript_67254/g.217050 Transcript_67254/m.217050 type:complete len:618 (+) Transcript_67254:57-1910(+)
MSRAMADGAMGAPPGPAAGCTRVAGAGEPVPGHLVPTAQREPAQTKCTSTPGHPTVRQQLLPLMEMPDRLLLDAKSPLPWTWRLPLDCDSPPESVKVLGDAGSTTLDPWPSDPSHEQAAGSSVVKCKRLSRVPVTAALERLPRASDEGADDAGVVEPFVRQLRGAKGDAQRIVLIVREAELACADDKHTLAKVYLAAVDLCSPSENPEEEELRDISVKCMRALCQVDPAEARAFHGRLCACSEGQADARIYEARASMEEHLGDTPRAVRVLQDGLTVGAQPAGLLQRMLQRLLPRAVQLPDPAVASGSLPQAGRVPRTAPQSGIGTPERGSSVANAWWRADRLCSVGRLRTRADAVACSTPAAEPQPFLAGLREELAEELCRVQQAMLEQSAQLHAELRRDIEGLRADMRRLEGMACRDRLHSADDDRRSHRCPRCCREAVEGAVELLMGGVLREVGEALGTQDWLQQRGSWQALADEVWEAISVTKTTGFQARAVGGVLAELEALRELLRSPDVARGRESCLEGHTAAPAVAARASSLRGGGGLGTAEELSEQLMQPAKQPMGHLTERAAGLRTALAEIQPWILREQRWQGKRTAVAVAGKCLGAALTEQYKENLS